MKISNDGKAVTISVDRYVPYEHLTKNKVVKIPIAVLLNATVNCEEEASGNVTVEIDAGSSVYVFELEKAQISQFMLFISRVVNNKEYANTST